MPYLGNIYAFTIEIGANAFYIATLVLIFGLSFLVVFLTLKMEPKKVHKLVLILLFINFGTQFLKILFPPYFNDFPSSLKVITPDNICAFSFVFFPFMYLSKNKYLRDYMVYMGVASGLAVFIFPTSYVDYHVGGIVQFLEIARFYVSHLFLTIAPLAMLGGRLHQLHHRRAIVFPLVFFGVLTFIGLNEVFLKLSHITNASWADILSPNYRNGALVFGPMSMLDASLGKFYFLIPSFFKYYYPGTNNLYYVPVLWLSIPAFILFTIGAFLLSLIYSHKDARLDFLKLKQKTKMRFKRSL